jgi:hypothetical protein
MMRARHSFLLLFVAALMVVTCYAGDTNSKTIPAGSKVYVGPMDDGFQEFLKGDRKEETPARNC